MKKKRNIYIGIAAVIGLAALAAIFSSGGTAVELVEVQKGNILRQVEETALVQAEDEHLVYTEQNATVSQINVEVGEAVSRGQLIMQLQNRDLAMQITETRSQMSQAQAALDAASASVSRLQLQLQDARADLQRTESLYNSGAVSQSGYDKAKLLVESTEALLQEQTSYQESYAAQVSGLQQLLAQSLDRQHQLQVYSPDDGTILDIPVEEEQPVIPGTLLAVVGSSEKLELKADILSDDLAEIRVGQKAIATSPVLGDTVLEGEVIKIYPRAEEKQSALGVIQRRVPVIISLENTGNLQPGYEVTVAIEIERLENVLLIPRESLRTNNNGEKEVLLVVDDRIKVQPVNTGARNTSFIEITKGLSGGAMIVRDGRLDLAPDTRVQPVS